MGDHMAPLKKIKTVQRTKDLMWDICMSQILLLNALIYFQSRFPLLLSLPECESVVLLLSQYSAPAQETLPPLLMKSVGSFSWALFQVWLGSLPVKYNSLQICWGWGGPRALAGRNVTWTVLHREAVLQDGALMHIMSGPNRKLTQRSMWEVAGENTCWCQWSCGALWEMKGSCLAFAL